MRGAAEEIEITRDSGEMTRPLLFVSVTVV